MKFYAVANGRVKGIYTDWEECKSMTDGFKCVKYKSFKKLSEAVDYMSNNSNCEQLLKVVNNIIREEK